MDKLKFVLVAAFLAAIGLRAQVTMDGYVFDQLPYVDNVCYELEYREKVKVTRDIDLSTLTIFDKLKFKQKNYQNNHYEYLDGDGNFAHDIAYVSHENMFPQWYSHPILIRTEKSGTSSFFDRRNQYLNDGWTGGHYTQTEHGEYIEDERTGLSYLSQPHSGRAIDFYDQQNALVQRFGFLYKYAFKRPTDQTLMQLQNEGYQVTFANNTIVVKNPSIVLIWDLDRTTTIRQHLEAGTIVKTVYTHYTYNTTFDNYLIVKNITVTPITFDNGDCAELLEEMVYTNFSAACVSAHLAQQEGEAAAEGRLKDISIQALSFYPNPTSGELMIEIPEQEASSMLTISSLAGSKLLVRKIERGTQKYALDISSLPNGMYTVQLIQGNNSYSSKLAKQ